MVAMLPTAAEKCQRLEAIATWETPGPGSFYDDIGHVGRSPRVCRGEADNTDPIMRHIPQPTFWWWDDGKSRARLSWQCTMDWPLRVVYEGLDPHSSYTVRLTGYGQSLLRMDGERVTACVDGREIGEFKEFPVPPHTVQDRRLVLTWDSPPDESHLNWRQQSARRGSVAPQEMTEWGELLRRASRAGRPVIERAWFLLSPGMVSGVRQADHSKHGPQRKMCT